VNLEDVLDPEYGLQQDDYSLSGVVFGEEGQIEVVGWSGKCRTAKYYILKCNKCSKDTELFGEGYFRSVKGSLVKGAVPCGCGRAMWSKEQFAVLCKRKATELGHTFLGFIGEWNGAYTKIKILCEKHGEWSSATINNLINAGQGCPGCGADATVKASIKPDDMMIASFHESGTFHPDTKFRRSERKNSQGCKVYWFMSCPECGEIGESYSSDLQRGQRPCACSKQRQQECYINWLIDDHNMAVAIKFGIARDSKRRVKQQDSKSAYTLKQHSVYTFPSVEQCKKAERECKKELECGVVLKRDMPDGYSETTWAYNIGKVKDIYERNGGVLV
jgi:hypothetical protein